MIIWERGKVMERLDLDGLHALVMISKAGGVTRAADMLSLSQPAVSHKIKRLEQALGCDLLARRPGGPLFTESGEKLLDYAGRMLDLNDAIFTSLGKQSLSGRIRLAMTEDTTGGDVARILGRFSRQHPQMNVQLKIAQSLVISDWINNGEMDVGVMQIFESEVQPDDIVLFTDKLHWVKSPNHILDFTKPISFLSFDSNCFYKHWAQKQGKQHGIEINPVLECPSIGGILSATHAGLGVALLNGLHLTPNMDILDDVFPVPPSICYVVRTSKEANSDAVKALINEIASEAASVVPLRVA